MSINFTRIKKDVNGNPRYVCHYFNLLKESEKGANGSYKYETALTRAKKLGGRKFHNKQYGGGIVFQSYNISVLTEEIREATKEDPPLSEYDQQAKDFLEQTGTRFSATFLSHDYYFDDEKETRDIYRIRLSNKKHGYSFKFGQSIHNTGIAPKPYDALACITKNDPGTFEEFCWEFGYDTDSKRAEKIYKSIVRQYENVCKLFNPAEISMLQEIN